MEDIISGIIDIFCDIMSMIIPPKVLLTILALIILAVMAVIILG